MKINFKRYALYLVRWQLTSPIMALCIVWFASLGTTLSIILANFIGGLIFFWVDRFIFNSDKISSWQVKEGMSCVDCGKVARGYRLVKSKDYDRTCDKSPEFRCEFCSEIKTKEIESRK